MFDDFLGLPLHAFLVHLTVVLLPLAATVAIVFAAVRRWRWLLRWPLLALAVTASPLTFVTMRAGVALMEERRLAALVGTHQARAELLLVFVLAFSVAALAAVFLLGGPTALASGHGARDGGAASVQVVLTVLLTVLAVAVIVQTALTGDAGARAVWDIDQG